MFPISAFQLLRIGGNSAIDFADGALDFVHNVHCLHIYGLIAVL